MTKLIEHDPVRTLFQDEPLPAAYDLTLAKILNDTLVLMRIEDVADRYFGALAISRMTEAEVYSLKKHLRYLLAQPGAQDKPGVLNVENAQERIRRHNTGDHSQCTPETCFIKAHPPAPAAEAPKPIPDAPEVEVITPRPAPAPRPHIRWYVDNYHQCITAEVPNDEIMRFSGKPEDAGTFKFRNEVCPAHIVAEYARMAAGKAA